MALFALNFWLRELLLSAIANRFECWCQLKENDAFAYRTCPRCEKDVILQDKMIEMMVIERCMNRNIQVTLASRILFQILSLI